MGTKNASLWTQPAGNYYDKYHTRNPIAQYLMNGFFQAFDELSAYATSTAYEVGCGEGYLSLRLAERGLSVSGCDVSSEIVEQARDNARQTGYDVSFEVQSVYDLNPDVAAAELVVCCEVMEHLEEPQQALTVLASLAQPYLLVSVPREPIWRMLNVARGHYIGRWGNTSGHIQHWSSNEFLAFLEQQIDVIEARRPLPWTMALCKSGK